MKYLLDTAVFLWIAREEEKKLSRKAIKALESADALYMSSASTWEIAIKYSSGKLELKEKPYQWLPNLILQLGLIPLPITQEHTLEVASLPFHHRDPFDRLLIAQSKSEDIPLIASDKIFKEYDVDCVW